MTGITKAMVCAIMSVGWCIYLLLKFAVVFGPKTACLLNKLTYTATNLFCFEIFY